MKEKAAKPKATTIFCDLTQYLNLSKSNFESLHQMFCIDLVIEA